MAAGGQDGRRRADRTHLRPDRTTLGFSRAGGEGSLRSRHSLDQTNTRCYRPGGQRGTKPETHQSESSGSAQQPHHQATQHVQANQAAQIKAPSQSNSPNQGVERTKRPKSRRRADRTAQIKASSTSNGPNQGVEANGFISPEREMTLKRNKESSNSF